MGELRVEGLSKQVGGFRLDASFEISVGERAGIVGRSGSGKTTLLRLIAGLERPDSGRVFLGGQDITDIPSEKRGIGFVFQDHALFPALNVMENITFGLRMRRVSRKERDAEGMSWLQRVGMASLARSPVHRLSGGERQRVAVLRAILWKPKALLLDEPFSALDVGMRVVLQKELIELHKFWSVPMLVVTHDEADMEALATSRLTINEDPNGHIRTLMKTPNNQR